MISLILLLSILNLILVFFLLSKKGKTETFSRRRGIWMDNACQQNNNCSTPDDLVKAVKQCKSDFKKSSIYSNFQNACNSTDEDVRLNACPELCDVKYVSSLILQPPPKPTCSNDSSHPDITTDDGYIYCWDSNQQDYFVKSKPKPPSK